MTSSLSVRMCRCCASKGTFKDIHTKYQWMGDEEVYADMLKDCFDINLSVPEDSDNGGICEVCITQLRNASNFKKQVLNTEELFKIHLQSRTFRSEVKCEEVELPDSIESEDDNLHDSTFEPPQEYEVSIKEETEDIKPKKKESAKASTSRKKAKLEVSDAPSKRSDRNVITCTKEKLFMMMRNHLKSSLSKQIEILEAALTEEMNRNILIHEDTKPILVKFFHTLRTMWQNSNRMEERFKKKYNDWLSDSIRIIIYDDESSTQFSIG